MNQKKSLDDGVTKVFIVKKCGLAIKQLLLEWNLVQQYQNRKNKKYLNSMGAKCPHGLHSYMGDCGVTAGQEGVSGSEMRRRVSQVIVQTGRK